MKLGIKHSLLSGLSLILVFACYAYWAEHRPIKTTKPVINSSVLTSVNTVSKVTWPVAGQSAVGVLGTNILDTHEPQVPVPTASTAKLITALTVLKAKPLAPGETGPVITLQPSDVAIYKAYVAEQGSVVLVTAGEQITEYQMLEAMLLPSANNMADSLAIWAYGSLSSYGKAANTYTHDELGLNQTQVGSDASGFLPSTTSTAYDLVKLGEDVMQNPILSKIVGQTSVTGIPNTTVVKNVNSLLGTNGVVGIKTGNTAQAGGVFVAAAKTIVNDQPVVIVTANAAVPTLHQALSDSVPLIQSSEANFITLPLAKAGTVVGSYNLPSDNSPLPASTANTVVANVWGGSSVTLNLKMLKTITSKAKAGQKVGTISPASTGLVKSTSSDVRLDTTPIKPTLWWRLTHP